MKQETIKNDKKTIQGWAIYDWANSVFNLVITTAVFPPFFVAVAPELVDVFGMEIKSSALYSYAISFSYLILALGLVFLSGIADAGGLRKPFMKVATIVGGLACAGLFLFDNPDMTLTAVVLFILALVGFGVSLVFYNSYLPDIATPDQHDKVSAKGYTYGYIGSVILLLVILAMIQFKGALGFDTESMPIRIGFILVGVWWIGFGLYAIGRLPSDSKGTSTSSLVADGMRELGNVGKQIFTDSNKVKFLCSYFFYIGGVNIVIYLASVFAKDELGFGSSELILLILLLQFLAAAGAFLFAYVSERSGNKLSLLIQLVIWVVICIAAYFVQGKINFYVIAVFVGLVFGGLQSLSRSTYSKMIDDPDIPLSSYFSFYQVVTYAGIFIGTLVFGLVEQMTQNMRYSILATSGFFILGLLILLSVHFSYNSKDKDVAEHLVDE